MLFRSSRLFPRVVRRTGAEEAGEEGLARSQPTSTEVPSFREELIKEDPSLRVEKFEELVGRPGIWKQVVVRQFTFLSSSSSYLTLYLPIYFKMINDLRIDWN